MASSAPRILEARREALLEAAQREGMQHVVIFGYGSALGAGTLSQGHLRFFSGWDGHESLSLLARSRAEAWLVVGSPFMLTLAQAMRLGLAVCCVHPKAWARALRGWLSGAAFAVVGFGEIPAQIENSLSGAAVLPPLLLDEVAARLLDEVAARLRLVKDSASLALMRDAAALCDESFARLGAELATRRPAWEMHPNVFV